MIPNRIKCRTYRQRLRERALSLFGRRCERCGATENLQFAHRQPTGLKGQGRGFTNRYLDVIKHRGKYRLLCVDCHRDYDNGRLVNEN